MAGIAGPPFAYNMPVMEIHISISKLGFRCRSGLFQGQEHSRMARKAEFVFFLFEGGDIRPGHSTTQ
jgi:hypothetical protein